MVAAPRLRDVVEQLQARPPVLPPPPLVWVKAWATEQALLLEQLLLERLPLERRLRPVHVRRELELPQRPVLALRASLAEESRP